MKLPQPIWKNVKHEHHAALGIKEKHAHELLHKVHKKMYFDDD